MKEKKKSWMQSVFAYAEKEKKKMVISVVLSVLSVSAGLFPLLHVPCDLLIHGGRGDDGRNRDVVSWSVGGVFC